MHSLEGTYICPSCIEDHDGPGKFEAYHDPEDLAKVQIIYHWMLDGMEDDQMWNEGWGYCGRFGQFLLMVDDRGFVTYEEYNDKADAENSFQSLWEDGWGANESDAFIGHERGEWYVSFDGEPLQVWGRGTHGHPLTRNEGIDQRRCIARVRLEAMKTGYYPPLWYQSDHGNLSLLRY